MTGEEGRADEIVIVRRRGAAEDDHHHGGVWKIAYADFMTAMMAFFLVMWLINASNTETKSSIASYFNPMKLTDNVARKKGLYDIDERSNASQKSKVESDGSAMQKQGAAKLQSPHSGVTDPQTKQPADKIVPNTDEAQSPQPRKDGAGATGEAFRDPFNPLASARQLIERSPQAPRNGALSIDTGPAGHERSDRAPDRNTLEKAEQVRRNVKMAVERLGLASGPGLDVTTEGDAIVLSLTDTSTFGMFAIGSSKPSDELVTLVSAIAPAVTENSGQLIIRGHTDSRPFPGTIGNNNWRLAMARAEAVYAMLIQSRVDDAKIERIEAHADRKPKDPSKPEAAVNRRIDILLRPINP